MRRPVSPLVRRWPGSGYTESAQFWLGNALYGKRDYKDAIAAFRVTASAAAHPRAAEAQLALANCQIELKDVKQSDRIVTIEGLSRNGSHPVQKAWLQHEVAQCGYCQTGQIMAAAALLRKKPKPTDKDIDEAMTNICRCGTYQRIRAAGLRIAKGKNFGHIAITAASDAKPGFALAKIMGRATIDGKRTTRPCRSPRRV